MNEKKPYAPPAVAVLPLARDLLLELLKGEDFARFEEKVNRFHL